MKNRNKKSGRAAERKRRISEKASTAENLESGIAFMHIPKTGGTSLGTMIRSIRKAGHVAPGRFGHPFTLRRIVKEFPETKVCVVLRDPIERTISSFLSRMRMGRPVYNIDWRPAEAVTFSFFPDAKSLLAGMASEDERLVSAVLFAFKGINHFRSNYVRYFESVDYVEENLHRFAVVGEMNRFDDFARAFVRKAAPEVTDISPYYAVKHVSAQKPSGLLDDFSDAEKERIHRYFAEDYKVYNRLRQLINC